MAKLAGVILVVILVAVVAAPQAKRFQKYKPVETYEVRPGFLMLPVYSAEGQMCKVVLEKRPFSSDKSTLDLTMSRKEIEEILAEIVPETERGPNVPLLGMTHAILNVSGSTTEVTDYENVTIQLFGSNLWDKSESPYISNAHVLIAWKKQKCK